MKKLVRFIPLHILLCVISGICISFFEIWKFNFHFLLYSLIVLLFLLVITHLLKKKLLFILHSTLFYILIGISSVHIQTQINLSNHYSHHLKKDSNIILSIEKELKPDAYNNTYKAEIIQVDSIKTTGNILLKVQRDSSANTKITSNTLFLAQPVLTEIIAPKNPHQFNYRSYLARQNIVHQVYIHQQQVQPIISNRFTFISLASQVKNYIQQSLEKRAFTKEQLAVISALFLGERKLISKDLLQNYTNAGAIHILAISGLHIGILLMVLTLILKPIERLPYGKIIKLILLITFLWMFAFITGLSASVIRAVTMFTFIAIGKFMNQKLAIEFAVINSMLLLLLTNPFLLLDVGFQLSYLAVFGIIWIQPLLDQLWQPKPYLAKKLWSLFTVSIAAQIGVMPISLYYFHQLPGLFILSNLAIVTFMTFILSAGIFVIVLSLLNILPSFLVKVYGFCISYMNTVVNWIAQQEQFIITNISMTFLAMFAWYLIIVFIFQFYIQKTVKRLILAFCTVLFLQGTCIYQKYEKHAKHQLIVFHKHRNSVIALREGNTANIISTMKDIRDEKFLTNYKIGEDITLHSSEKRPKLFYFKENYFLMIDSLGVYPNQLPKQPIVILEHSSKINLNRLIATLKPAKIIADGSNYRSYIERWKTTCIKQKTPFHYTGEHGAYIFE